LPFGYGCRCQLRQTPCILIVRAHAGHTRSGFSRDAVLNWQERVHTRNIRRWEPP
jgi:hypothetical protein